MLCGTCGSTDVSRDAWGDWDVAAQEWVLRTVFDHAHWRACDGETRLGREPIKISTGGRGSMAIDLPEG